MGSSLAAALAGFRFRCRDRRRPPRRRLAHFPAPAWPGSGAEGV